MIFPLHLVRTSMRCNAMAGKFLWNLVTISRTFALREIPFVSLVLRDSLVVSGCPMVLILTQTLHGHQNTYGVSITEQLQLKNVAVVISTAELDNVKLLFIQVRSVSLNTLYHLLGHEKSKWNHHCFCLIKLEINMIKLKQSRKNR